MKTIAKILTAAILLMVSFQSFSANDKGNPLPGSGMITYKVTVHIPADLAIFGGHFLVVITNEKGRMVAPMQRFNINKDIYTFSEAGPVKGTRVAALVPDANADCPSLRTIIPPDVQTGTFAAGSVYYFNLWPSTTRTR